VRTGTTVVPAELPDSTELGRLLTESGGGGDTGR
jgi:hypothetical protein